MTRRRAGWVAVAVVSATLLSGCDVSGRIEARADGSASVDLTIWDDVTGVGQLSYFCDDRIVTGQSSEGLRGTLLRDPGGDPNRLGCHLVGDLTPELVAEASLRAPYVHLLRGDGRVGISTHPELVSAIGRTTRESVPTPGATEAPAPTPGSGSLDVTVQMPGAIVGHDPIAQIEGREARYRSLPDGPTRLWVTSLDGTTLPDRTVLGIAGASGLLVGLAGALTVRLLRRRPDDDPTTRASAEEAGSGEPASAESGVPDDPGSGTGTSGAPGPSGATAAASERAAAEPDDPTVWARRD